MSRPTDAEGEALSNEWMTRQELVHGQMEYVFYIPEQDRLAVFEVWMHCPFGAEFFCDPGDIVAISLGDL